MAGKRPAKKKRGLGNLPFFNMAAGILTATALAVGLNQFAAPPADMPAYNPGDLSQTFGCEADPYNCTIDLGNSQALAFEDLAEFYDAKTMIDTGLKTEYKGALVPADVNRALLVASIMTPYSYGYWLDKTFSESTFNKNAFNQGTKARGLFQIKPETALETLYYMAQSGDYANIPEAQNVERKSLKDKDKKTVFRFSVREGVDENKLLGDVLNDPMKAVFVASAHISRYLMTLDRESTELDAFLVHWQGLGGMRKLYRALDRDPNMPAYMVYTNNVKADMVKLNYAMFMDENDRARSVQGMIDYIQTTKNIKATPLGDLKEFTRPGVMSTTDVAVSELNGRYFSAYFPYGGEKMNTIATRYAIDNAVKRDNIGSLINSL